MKDVLIAHLDDPTFVREVNRLYQIEKDTEEGSQRLLEWWKEGCYDILKVADAIRILRRSLQLRNRLPEALLETLGILKQDGETHQEYRNRVRDSSEKRTPAAAS